MADPWRSSGLFAAVAWTLANTLPNGKQQPTDQVGCGRVAFELASHATPCRPATGSRAAERTWQPCRWGHEAARQRLATATPLRARAQVRSVRVGGPAASSSSDGPTFASAVMADAIRSARPVARRIRRAAGSRKDDSGAASCLGFSRARVAGQYFGESSSYRSFGQYGSTPPGRIRKDPTGYVIAR
jgi:hypothetical protein